MRSFTARTAVSVVLSGSVAFAGCSSEFVETSDSGHDDAANVVRELRTDAVGCWSLISDVEMAPSSIRLDTTLVDVGSAVRHVRRLDATGAVEARDWEGFETLDRWRGETVGDVVHISFNNGLYGSSWRLQLERRGAPRDTMRGRAKAFGDEVAGPDYRYHEAVAIRTPCTASSTPMKH